MAKNSISFFVVLLSVSFIIYPMDLSDNTVKKVINLSNSMSVEFIENKEIFISKPYFLQTIISIDSEKLKKFIRQYKIDSDWTILTDRSKARIVFAQQSDNCWRFKIYDPRLQNLPFESSADGIAFDKALKTSLDGKKQNSVLLYKKNNIISYDYVTNVEEDYDDYFSTVFKDRNFGNFKCAFNDRVGNYMIGQCDRGFVAFFRCPDSRDCLKITYKLQADLNGDGEYDYNYLSSSDMSFIACYPSSGINRSCYILDKMNDNPIQLGSQDHRIYPCAMEIHPNDKVLVTMSAGNRLIQYWQAATGVLLSEQKMLNSKEGDIDQEKGKFHKYLAISANGKLLAAVYRDQVVIYHIPIEAVCNMTRKQLIYVLWSLRNMPLPKDIKCLIFEALQQ